jgi:uncharacterized protein YutE (UPF0331/DUF86 family)
VTIDPALVTRKLLLIAADLEALKPVAARGVDAYLANHVEQAFVERYLERTIGRMIDVNYHLLTAAGHPPPPDYYASFVGLADLGVLDAAFAREIARAAGLRNRLVHEYEGLDPVKVFQALATALDEIPRYIERVNRHLQTRASSSPPDPTGSESR